MSNRFLGFPRYCKGVGSIFLDRRNALHRYEPPAESVCQECPGGPVVVCTGLELAPSAADELKGIHEQHGPYGVESTVRCAVTTAFLATVALDHGLRLYLLDREYTAHEIPPRPFPGSRPESPVVATVPLRVGAWSTLMAMEGGMGMSPGITVGYGLDVMSGVPPDGSQQLRFVGREGQRMFGIGVTLDLVPPGSSNHSPQPGS